MNPCVFSLRSAWARSVSVAVSLVFAALGGCATLPSNGPTAGQIEKAVEKAQAGPSLTLVDLSPSTVASLAAEPVNGNANLATLIRPGEMDSPELIRPGDMLSIAIYEVGVSLFSAQTAAGGELSSQVTNPVANAQRINGVQVDEAGGIQLPYIGYLSIAGLSPRTVEALIEQRLRGMSQSPRALVSIADSLATTFYLSGAVARPGRYRLTIAREKLRDYLTIAGGVQGDPEDLAVRLLRDGKSVEMRLSEIAINSANDVVLLPGDQVEIVKRPRTYSVFGASDRVAQVPFGAPELSLSEAIARAGGPSDARANPRGVFLFRMEQGQEGARPVIYRLNMMDAGQYFLAQQVRMRDKDIIYFSNSASGPPTKLIGIINQLFGPFVTARALTQ
ncbi:polysaccharide export protein [Sphingobium chlorophenolicum L-1]|uniref:Polysaccharide export protein n=1 Tax=Sphingobium chlorophenolicum L-1 TaxID=690566 RepID=F6F0L7_SPHCR|nr:polysaccharide biosynthesis/export family protein [Sphingobium chlorophenolicum]AEG50339.1 polysaccharide export protein [Sphingobium chlorophenolicum L-1]